MKSLLIGVSIAATMLAMLNRPSKEDYAQYLVQNWQSRVCTQPNLPTDQKMLCDVGGVFPVGVKTYIAQGYITEKNHVFFTVYQFNLGTIETRTISIGGQFVNL
ncbi:hypothetical protein LEP3755_39090 [Leptolyngbya sp. NIES-3755]|nr:hypothetical protein LEP3755_39090 [Leptolyngbya sp. NIES-3755]